MVDQLTSHNAFITVTPDLNDEGHDEWLWASEQLLSALPEPRRVTLVAQEHQSPTVASTVQPFYDSANHDQDVRLALAALSP